MLDMEWRGKSSKQYGQGTKSFPLPMASSESNKVAGNA